MQAVIAALLSLSRPLLDVLHTLHGLTGSWGASLALLPLLVMLLTLTWNLVTPRARRSPPSRALAAVPSLLRLYVLASVYALLLWAPDLRGARFLWLPDLTRPDPLYVVPLVVLIYMGALAWIAERAVPQARWPGRLMALLWAGIVAVLPAGMGVYHIAAQARMPLIALVFYAPLMLLSVLLQVARPLLRREALTSAQEFLADQLFRVRRSLRTLGELGGVTAAADEDG